MELDAFSCLVGWMAGGLFTTVFFMAWSARRLFVRQRNRSD